MIESNKNDIMFSFLELTISDFSFTVFRRAYNRNNHSKALYRYSLPTDNTKIDRDIYAISFNEMENGTEFLCNSHYNYNLTKKWLMENLINKVKNSFQDDKYIIDDHFIPRILFIISSHKEGDCVVSMEPYYLETTRSFGFLLDYKFQANRGFEKTKEAKILSLSLMQNGMKNKNFYSDKLKYIEAFINNYIKIIFPVQEDEFSFNVTSKLTNLKLNLLNEKTYIFKNGQSMVQFQGLQEYKPIKEVGRIPLFVFIFEKSKVNTARQLVKALRGQLYNTFSGMEKMFGVELSNSNIKSIEVENYSKENLGKIKTSLESIVAENFEKEIVGIFTGIAKDFDTNNDYSPYYTVKKMFLQYGYAVQAVTMEQAIKKDGFKWSVSGMALQIFAKMGGHPWKVKPQNENCLIFGISSAHIKDNDGNIVKYFAYSLCFDSSGIYKRLDVLGQSNDEQSYIEQLSNQIKTKIRENIDDTIDKCVIHVPFKIKRSEMSCIKESVDLIKKTHQKIEFSVIKINVNNKFFGYSHYNSHIPLAGSYIALGKKEFLVWFEGLQQGSTQVISAQNISNPVHIKFLYGRDFNDKEIKAYLQDIINLSGANWRGFNAKHEPVSTLYPQLIARFAGKFSQYDFDLEIGEKALDKAWFL